jgi:phytoene synthase
MREPTERGASASYLLDIVRRADRPRYVATLFVPQDAREDLFALYAFAAEIARIPDAVSDPALGEIRLVWWRERLEGRAAEGGEGSPILQALFGAVERRRLPIPAIVRLVEARSVDLYADPPADVEALEALLGETESALFQLAGLVLGAKGPEIADASGHAGIAYGLNRRLAHFSHDRRRGRCILPLTILARHGLTAADTFVQTPPPALAGAISEAAGLARAHLDKARVALRGVPPPVRPAFLPLAVVAPSLHRIDGRLRRGEEPDGQVSNLATLARITWAAMRSDRRRSR